VKSQAYIGTTVTMKYLLSHVQGIPPEDSDAATGELVKCCMEAPKRPRALELVDMTRPMIDDDNHNWTTLHIAADRGDVDMVKYLVEKGANPSAHTLFGQTPLQVAAIRLNSEVVDYLSQLQGTAESAKGPSCGYNFLHLAAWNGDATLINRLVKAKGDPSLSTSEGWTPLHLAAQNGHLKVVELLLQLGVELEPVSVAGFLPLHLAAQNGHGLVVERLLRDAKGFNAPCKDGRTPIQMANANRHSDVVEMLGNSMVDSDIPSRSVPSATQGMQLQECSRKTEHREPPSKY
jgi:ankyrin repeat protein